MYFVEDVYAANAEKARILTVFMMKRHSDDKQKFALISRRF